MPLNPTPARITPLSNELLPGHRRFTLYFRFDYGDDFLAIEEIDIDAASEIEATTLAIAIFEDPDQYEPGGKLMAGHTRERVPGEMYF